MGCELDLHNHSYDNPFDVDAYSEDDFSPPAIIFSPNTVNITVGETVPVNISVLEVDGLGGVHAQVLTQHALSDLVDDFDFPDI